LVRHVVRVCDFWLDDQRRADHGSREGWPAWMWDAFRIAEPALGMDDRRWPRARRAAAYRIVAKLLGWHVQKTRRLYRDDAHYDRAWAVYWPAAG
jgi:hypothetical protein